MANLLREHRLIDNNKRALLKYVFVSDGTAAANVTLVDASTLNYALNANGYIMSSNTNPLATYRTSIKRIFGYANGPTAGSYYKLQWGSSANTEIITFGSSQFDYNFSINGDTALINNPDANSTGDILLTVSNMGAGNTFTLFIDLKKDNNDYDAGQTADPRAFNR